jgi:hypothetical protein
MDIKINMTAHIDEAEVKAIVKDYLYRQGYDVETITISVTNQWQGYGHNEHQVPVFSGIDVKLKVASPKPPSPRDTPIPGGYI